jgi:hypothetical protein
LRLLNDGGSIRRLTADDLLRAVIGDPHDAHVIGLDRAGGKPDEDTDGQSAGGLEGFSTHDGFPGSSR